MGHAQTKIARMTALKIALLKASAGLTFGECVAVVEGDTSTTWRHLKELGATAAQHGRYTLDPTEADIELAQAVLERAAKLQ